MAGWVVAMDRQKAHPVLRHGPALLRACSTRPIYVMTAVRTTAGINKANPASTLEARNRLIALTRILRQRILRVGVSIGHAVFPLGEWLARSEQLAKRVDRIVRQSGELAGNCARSPSDLQRGTCKSRVNAIP